MERLFEEVFVEVWRRLFGQHQTVELVPLSPQNRDKLLEALDFWNRELEPSGLQVQAAKSAAGRARF